MKNNLLKFKNKLEQELSNIDNKDEITLIAASKYYGASEIRELYQKGQKDFGENRLQEALKKMQHLSDLKINWHFFGHIQTNKVKKIAQNFSFIHSVDSFKAAKALNTNALNFHKKLNVFLQVNLADEERKFGFDKNTLFKELPEIFKLKSLIILGLMIITPYYENLKDSQKLFKKCRDIQNEINKIFGSNLKFLSMGMSRDWKQAIKEGSTHLRIGRALFE